MSSDYTISTPENVDLHLELAGVGNRVLAYLVDLMLLAAFTIAWGIVCWGAGFGGETLMKDSDHKIVAPIAAAIFMIGTFLLSLFYFLVFEGVWHGQTPGKKLAHIRVIQQSGAPAGWGAICFRNIMRYFDQLIFCIGFLFMVFLPSQKRLGDLAAGTIVVRERSSKLDTRPITVAEAATNSGVDAGTINPEEYDLLQNFLRRRLSISKGKRPLLAQELAGYFRHKLGYPADTMEAKRDSELFLEQLFVAYQERGAV